MTSYNNKPKPVILVTGSAKRIGAEIIRHAHAHGYNCIIHYHQSSDSAKQLANELNSIREHSAKIIQGDLALVNHEDLLSDFITGVMACFGRLDALVNNASRFYPTPFSHKPPHTRKPSHKELLDSWDELFLTNAKAPLLLSHALLPYLQQTQGTIINILDIHADNKPFINYPMYNMAKSSAHMMVQSLALELAPDIRVNGVSPGTNIFPEADSDHVIDSDLQSQISQSIPLGRIGKPCDIANAVMYLLQAEYVTGHVIAVDGGRGLTIKGG